MAPKRDGHNMTSLEIEEPVYERLCRVARDLKVQPDRLAAHLLEVAYSES